MDTYSTRNRCSFNCCANLCDDKKDLLDRTFLDKYTIGFSENTLPQDAAKNSSYESYVLGLNDGVEKTPDWASKITKIPARRIVQLAREIATIKPCFIEQGWGV
ncbi:hypothetical protein B10089_15250 [Campylobacter jejuni]|nr:hypothetical protein B10089_15250 [Campylobacter jejuni]